MQTHDAHSLPFLPSIYHFVFAWTEGVPVMCFSVSVQAFLIAAVAYSPCCSCSPGAAAGIRTQEGP